MSSVPTRAAGSGFAGRRDGRALAKAALVAAALAAFIAVVYTAVALGLGAVAGGTRRSDTVLSVVATTMVAVGFARMRAIAERWANRVVYGQRVTPYEALARLSQQAAATSAGDEMLDRMAELVAQATGAARADVWLRVGRELAPVASWPADAPMPWQVELDGEELPELGDVDHAVALRRSGELIGAITVVARPDRPITSPDRKLLGDLASQAGLVAHNVRLTAELAARIEEIAARAVELRRSRQRIVAAQDGERRRLESDIHDGAQQHLVALAVRLGMAKSIARKDPEQARPLLAELRTVMAEALETLRDLSRGIYPPALTDGGIVDALRAHAATARIPVTVTAAGVARYAAEIEAAVYFTCAEAIQNAAKHAAGAVEVRVEADGDALRFAVADEGPGFDEATIARGSGLQNMKDRVAAFGGSLEIRSRPGRGTTVAGTIPVRAREGA